MKLKHFPWSNFTKSEARFEFSIFLSQCLAFFSVCILLYDSESMPALILSCLFLCLYLYLCVFVCYFKRDLHFNSLTSQKALLREGLRDTLQKTLTEFYKR